MDIKHFLGCLKRHFPTFLLFPPFIWNHQNNCLSLHSYHTTQKPAAAGRLRSGELSTCGAGKYHECITLKPLSFSERNSEYSWSIFDYSDSIGQRCWTPLTNVSYSLARSLLLNNSEWVNRNRIPIFLFRNNNHRSKKVARIVGNLRKTLYLCLR